MEKLSKHQLTSMKIEYIAYSMLFLLEILILNKTFGNN